MEGVYPRFATQVVNLNRNGSVTAGDGSAAGAEPLTIYQPNRLRVRQSGPSTQALVALLAAMGLCVAATVVVTTGIGEVLPKNPRSVAGVGSLLAGAQTLEDRKVGGGLCVEEEGEEDEEEGVGGKGRRDEQWRRQGFSIGFWNKEVADEEGEDEGDRLRFRIDIRVPDVR